MKRSVLSLSMCVLTLVAGGLPAQEPNGQTFYLLDKTMNIKVTARIIGTNEELAWNMEASYITISGRTVTIPLKGDNLVVLVHVTPYKESNNEILLVAQGQVWYTPTGSKEVKYLSTLKSLPIQLGEKLLFFPFGKDLPLNPDSEQPYSDIFVVQFQVLPFQDNPMN